MGSWCRPVVWLWSAGLLVGSVSWLRGQSSGKLFLDWSGYARVLFPLSLFALWLLLAAAFLRSRDNMSARIAKGAGLLVLLGVPFAIYFASDPGIYAAVNPASGGPTGASQLESTLGVVLILLALPFAMARRTKSSRSISGRRQSCLRAAWLRLLPRLGCPFAEYAPAPASTISPAVACRQSANRLFARRCYRASILSTCVCRQKLTPNHKASHKWCLGGHGAVPKKPE